MLRVKFLIVHIFFVKLLIIPELIFFIIILKQWKRRRKIFNPSTYLSVKRLAKNFLFKNPVTIYTSASLPVFKEQGI